MPRLLRGELGVVVQRKNGVLVERIAILLVAVLLVAVLMKRRIVGLREVGLLEARLLVGLLLLVGDLLLLLVIGLRVLLLLERALLLTLPGVRRLSSRRLCLLCHHIGIRHLLWLGLMLNLLLNWLLAKWVRVCRREYLASRGL